MKNYLVFSMAALLVGASCNTKQEKAAEGFTGAPGEVKLITLDPGHFHAALVQKVSYPQVVRTHRFRRGRALETYTGIQHTCGESDGLE